MILADEYRETTLCTVCTRLLVTISRNHLVDNCLVYGPHPLDGNLNNFANPFY